MTSPSLPRPELLAPAGDRECLRAAVENGADAVYFGLNCGFNARARATNIEPDELADVMSMLHHRGVKGYVTLNTLAFSDELPELERLVRRIAVADVDAVLVQDFGVARLIRAICPDLAIHASTQMTLTSAECIRVAEELGIERVVLPRELSIREIAKLKQQTSVELEAFVHGALCVAYSGQCLTSESLGGRSANRGQCAQACRLPYDLICDGEDVDLGDQKYLLSPQDLAAYGLTTDLIAAGVSSFKIEGRLKTPEYVANITKHYRAAIDAAVNGEPVEFTRDEVREMELSFSRGFSPGWLNGDDHKMLVPGFSSSKRGVLLGEIIRVYEASVEVRLSGPVARGDGVVFEGDREANAEQGGRVFGILQRGRSLEQADGGTVELEFQRGAINFGLIEEGHSIWKTDDPKLTARLRKTFTGPDPLRKRPIDVRVRCIAGEPLTLSAEFGMQSAEREDAVVQVASREPLAVAMKHPISEVFLREQLSRLGNTAYELRHLDAEISGGPMVPLSVLSKLRQELVARLDVATKQPRERRLFEGQALTALRSSVSDARRAATVVPSPPSSGERARVRGPSGDDAFPTQSISVPQPSTIDPQPSLESPPHPSPLPPKAGGEGTRAAPRLHVLCRTLDQLRAVTSCDSLLVSSDLQPSTLDPQPLLYADFADIREYREAVAIAHAAGCEIFLATPRIQKPDEMGLFRTLLKHEADGILVRNLSGMQFYADEGVPFVADYSLNCTNELTAQFLMSHGPQRITASYDMNRDQLLGLVDAVQKLGLNSNGTAVGWDQRRFAAPAHHDVSMNVDGGPALEASLSHPTKETSSTVEAARPEWLEVVVHQHMPMFHMEHCVFCAVLSPGTNKHNCGRPCDTHLVQLRDRVGSEHPLHADVGCRNTLFNAVPQSGAEVVASLLERGVQDFRIEFLDEQPAEIHRVLKLYGDLLAGRVRSDAVWKQLNAANRVGVTRGTLEERRNPLAIL